MVCRSSPLEVCRRTTETPGMAACCSSWTRPAIAVVDCANVGAARSSDRTSPLNSRVTTWFRWQAEVAKHLFLDIKITFTECLKPASAVKQGGHVAPARALAQA